MSEEKPKIVETLIRLLTERGHVYNYCEGINPPVTWEIHFCDIDGEMEYHIITRDTKVYDLWWLT